jgi:hypothetical protein
MYGRRGPGCTGLNEEVREGDGGDLECGRGDEGARDVKDLEARQDRQDVVEREVLVVCCRAAGSSSLSARKLVISTHQVLEVSVGVPSSLAPNQLPPTRKSTSEGHLRKTCASPRFDNNELPQRVSFVKLLASPRTCIKSMLVMLRRGTKEREKKKRREKKHEQNRGLIN